MEKDQLNDDEQKIINDIKDIEFREKLQDGFQRGSFMTANEFCQKLETLKNALINRHEVSNGNSNSNN